MPGSYSIGEFIYQVQDYNSPRLYFVGIDRNNTELQFQGSFIYTTLGPPASVEFQNLSLVRMDTSYSVSPGIAAFRNCSISEFGSMPEMLTGKALFQSAYGGPSFDFYDCSIKITKTYFGFKSTGFRFYNCNTIIPYFFQPEDPGQPNIYQYSGILIEGGYFESPTTFNNTGDNKIQISINNAKIHTTQKEFISEIDKDYGLSSIINNVFYTTQKDFKICPNDDQYPSIDRNTIIYTGN